MVVRKTKTAREIRQARGERVGRIIGTPTKGKTKKETPKEKVARLTGGETTKKRSTDPVAIAERERLLRTSKTLTTSQKEELKKLEAERPKTLQEARTKELEEAKTLTQKQETELKRIREARKKRSIKVAVDTTETKKLTKAGFTPKDFIQSQEQKKELQKKAFEEKFFTPTDVKQGVTVRSGRKREFTEGEKLLEFSADPRVPFFPAKTEAGEKIRKGKVSRIAASTLGIGFRVAEETTQQLFINPLRKAKELTADPFLLTKVVKEPQVRKETLETSVALGGLSLGTTLVKPSVRVVASKPSRVKGNVPFERPRISLEGQLERGFQPRGEELGLVKGELQSQLVRPKRVSRADLFEEIRITSDPVAKQKLSKQLVELIDPEGRPTPKTKTVSDFPTLRQEFLKGRQATVEGELFQGLKEKKPSGQLEFFVGEETQVKLTDIRKAPKGIKKGEKIFIEDVNTGERRVIIFDKKGQARLGFGTRVVKRPGSFFGLEPKGKFKSDLGGSSSISPRTTPLRFVPLSRGGTGTPVGLRSDVVVLQEPKSFVKIRSKGISDVGRTTAQGLVSKQTPATDNFPVSDQQFSIKQSQKSLQAQEPVTVTEQSFDTTQKFRTQSTTESFARGRDVTPRASRGRVVTPFVPFFPTDAGSGLFTTQVRREGKFRTIGGATSKGEAFRRGRRIVSTTPAASFKVTRLGGQTVGGFSLGSGFRRSGKEEGVFIERRSRRISSPGEIAGISFKGIQAQKTKKRKGLIF